MNEVGVFLSKEIEDELWGFIDGKNYKIQKPSDSEQQNSMYNGWLHQAFVTGVMCFGADGTIIWGKHNFSGSWNNGDMSRKFIEKLLDEKKNNKEIHH